MQRSWTSSGGGLTPAGRLTFQWSELFSTNLLFICLMYFCMAYTLYFNLTWLPTYLREVRGFSVQQAGYVAGAILLTGALGTYIGGRVTDRLVKTYGLKIGRSLGVVTLPVSGLLLVAAALVDNPITAAVLFALTLGVADLCVSSCWSICHDVGGERAGYGDRRDEYMWKHWRSHQSTRGRICRAGLEFLDHSVFHYCRGLRGRGDSDAADQSE